MYYTVVANSEIALFSFFEKVIDVYDLNTLKKLNRIYTKYEFDGNRLAINRMNNRFCSAGYNNGIALYELNSGKEIWANKTIKNIQSVFLAEKYAFVYNDLQELHILFISSGICKHCLEDIEDIYTTDVEGRYIIKRSSTLELLEMRDGMMHVSAISAPKVNSSIHIAALFKESLIISYLHQSLMCYSLNGNLLWKSDIGKGYVLNSISMNKAKSELCCFASYNTNVRQKDFVIHVAFQTGKVVNSFMLDENVIDIVPIESKGLIICSNGAILDLKSGEFLSQILQE